MGGDYLSVISFEFPIIYVGTGKVADLRIHSILCVQHNHRVMGTLQWRGGGRTDYLSVIYVVTGEVADLWVHPILRVQHNHRLWVLYSGGGLTCQF